MKWVLFVIITIVVFSGVYALLDHAYGAEPQNKFLVYVAVVLAYLLGVFNVFYTQYFQNKERY